MDAWLWCAADCGAHVQSLKIYRNVFIDNAVIVWFVQKVADWLNVTETSTCSMEKAPPNKEYN